MGMEMSMGMGVKDGGDAMTKGWGTFDISPKALF
jgi:hypothetical protein